MDTTLPCVIGVDIGTQSTKAVLMRTDGRIVAQHSHGYAVDTPQPMWAQQWPDVWLDAVAVCVAAVAARAAEQGVAREDIRALCISSLYGGSGIPLDAHGEVVGPCLI